MHDLSCHESNSFRKEPRAASILVHGAKTPPLMRYCWAVVFGGRKHHQPSCSFFNDRVPRGLEARHMPKQLEACLLRQRRAEMGEEDNSTIDASTGLSKGAGRRLTTSHLSSNGPRLHDDVVDAQAAGARAAGAAGMGTDTEMQSASLNLSNLVAREPQ
eukprot:1678432-Prymnesium_polylepis.1